MFLQRSAQDVLKDAAVLLAQNTPFTNFSAGAIARSIVEAMAPEIGAGTDTSRASLYQFAQQVLDEGFLSKATDDYLDLIGGLFSYPRRIEQVRDENGVLAEQKISNDSYRYEISQIVPSMATANYAALRLALLTIQGVKDVIGKEYSHGTGSFSFMLIPMYGFDEKEVISQMNAAIDATKAFGVRPNIIVSEKIPVDVSVQLLFHETTDEIQKANILTTTQIKLTEYFGKHEIGQSFIYNDMVQEIMNASDKIIDMEILAFSINNEPVLLTNHTLLDDEQLIPQTIQVS